MVAVPDLSQAGGTRHLQMSVSGVLGTAGPWEWVVGPRCVPCRGRGLGGPEAGQDGQGAGPRLPETGPQDRVHGGALLPPAAVGRLVFVLILLLMKLKVMILPVQCIYFSKSE
ncbi:unnamed protein product [Gulo gulo]|uniref:Uncharacterized protein n=1 Tax=Gulo gulo TaxID=48420 RepID=A0A9X9PV48_GULGU|nr:unnamed protein product [Gulo gulo]